MDQKRRRAFQILTCTGTALIITLCAVVLDARATRSHQTEDALRFARQVAEQATGLTFHARERGFTDPVGWAATELSQAVDPRAMRIAKVEASKDVKNGETYLLNSESGFLDYSRVIVPQEKLGIRVLIWVPYVGFLGSRNSLINDLLVEVVFATVWFWSSWVRRRGSDSTSIEK